MTVERPHESPPLDLGDYSRTALATGLSARNVRELRERVASVPPASLFHHFWGRLLRCEPGGGEYGNDLAEWTAHRLQDPVLAERMALLDPLRLRDMEHLREALCQLLETRIEEVDGRTAEVPPDEEFHFIFDQMVVYSTGRSVAHPEELLPVLDELSDRSVFLHFVDPPGLGVPPRFGAATWIRGFGSRYDDLASDLESLDIFLMSVHELRERVRSVLEGHLEGEGAR